MGSRIYALLVGINDYPAHVGPLSGCVRDVEYFHGFLNDAYDRSRLNVEILLNGDATRANIVAGFRRHLSRATADDIVVFQFSGHGARTRAARPFSSLFPGGKDEGLVCIDSRQPGNWDLADKELALLLAEIACHGPHIVTLFDCCHSGSATRGPGDFTHRRARYSHEVLNERPLDSYLDGHYSRLLRAGQPLTPPPSRHILLAACERGQKAWESRDQRGIFTHTLLDVLDKTGPNISYADLFVRSRAEVRKRADDQTPQFETHGGFPAYAGFLGASPSRSGRRYNVTQDQGVWRVECGAVHGLPCDSTTPVEFAVYAEDSPGDVSGRAIATRIGPQRSDLSLIDITADPKRRYQAEVTSLPVDPLWVLLTGETVGTDLFRKGPGVGHAVTETGSDPVATTSAIAFTSDVNERPRYLIVAANGEYRLSLRESGRLIQGARGYTPESVNYLLSTLEHIAAWERSLALENHRSRLDPRAVKFAFCELPDDDEADPTDDSLASPHHEYDQSEIVLDIAPESFESPDSGLPNDSDAWKMIRCQLRANNRSGQTLHFLLVHFSDDFGQEVLYNEPIEPTESDFIVALGGYPSFNLTLDESEGDQAEHTFKLIVSTEKVDDFLLEQEPLPMGHIHDPQREKGGRGLLLGDSARSKVQRHDWFTKDIQVTLVRQSCQLGNRDTRLAQGQVTIKGHPRLRAGVSFRADETPSSSARASRHADTSAYLALERSGLQVVHFAGARAIGPNVLELTNIENPEVLSAEPLEIELDVKLDDGEYLLPVTFDGEHFLLGGEATRDESGRARVTISSIPALPTRRRSLTKALKLYFFKTYLGQKNVNRLGWLDFQPDGGFTRQRSGVAAKVASARNVLLLIHGIIGDTRNIATGLPHARDEAGRSVLDKFDLVLTYDYENLSTPIAETAAQLKQQLADAGLRENDDRRLTIVAHSMGGLVARWFIEREGGRHVVDRLFMFGTPNDGSPFGKIAIARRLTSLLTTLAINAFPAFAPFGAALLSALVRSAKLTPTLEQMDPGSDFLRTLNTSEDPGVPYTIVSGDARDYRESSDSLVAQLIAKVGGSLAFDALFGDVAHDIAVSEASILAIPDVRQPQPHKVSTTCHHLNYFESDAGRKELSRVV